MQALNLTCALKKFLPIFHYPYAYYTHHPFQALQDYEEDCTPSTVRNMALHAYMHFQFKVVQY